MVGPRPRVLLTRLCIFCTSHYLRNRAFLRTAVQQGIRIAFVMSEGYAAVNHVQQPPDTDCIMGREGRSVSETVYCLVNSGALHQVYGQGTLCDISQLQLHFAWLKLPPRYKWGLRSSGLFHRSYWWLVKDVAGQPIGSTFNDKAVQ
jgi:hypothetical protein